MPRVARYIVPGVPVHIVQRGINRNGCFFSERDYESYLHLMGEASARFGCAIHAYCLMTNHVHILASAQAHDACAKFMKRLGQCYVQSVNARLKRTGTLWEGRFHSSIALSDEHLLACYRYIELNPVRAGMVERPELYAWSSYPGNAGLSIDPLLQPHPAYQALGGESGSAATAYAGLVAAGLEQSLADQIRKATRTGCVIGTTRRRPGRPRGRK